MDFTLSKYRELLNFLRDNYSIYTVEGYLVEKPKKDFVILRHDVDRSPKNALKMAELENELKVRSTYYFRYPYTFRPKIIKRINELGHEVGYHYETLSKAKGNYEKAIQMFEKELQEFRKLVDVKTISMHGSPLSKYDNRLLWDRYDFREYGIIGEAYLSINDSEILYITDTGRNWGNRHNIRDKYIWKSINGKVEGTNHLIGILGELRPRKLYITVHPERWGYNLINWGIGSLRDLVFNTGKLVMSHGQRS
jgi:tetratricopeptide (TPR) repeat protein